MRGVRKRLDALDCLAADVEEAQDRGARGRDGEGGGDRDDEGREREHEHPAARGQARSFAETRADGRDEVGLPREGEQPPDLAEVALELSHTSPSAGRARGRCAT